MIDNSQSAEFSNNPSKPMKDSAETSNTPVCSPCLLDLRCQLDKRDKYRKILESGGHISC